MVSNRLENPRSSIGVTQEVSFAGDSVRLAGQIDYPKRSQPSSGYPLIFVIQHATCTARKGYEHIATIGTQHGMAVFRWDKRGTGRSGCGGSGSVTVDTLKAYEKAVNSPSINANEVVIFAQNEGSLLLHDAYEEFEAIQRPTGIILAGNMLDDKKIIAFDAPLHIIVSKNDWNAWQIYAERAAEAHANYYDHYKPSFYVATNTNRRLMYTSGNTFHRGAETSIRHWLQHTCQIL